MVQLGCRFDRLRPRALSMAAVLQSFFLGGVFSSWVKGLVARDGFRAAYSKLATLLLCATK